MKVVPSIQPCLMVLVCDKLRIFIFFFFLLSSFFTVSSQPPVYNVKVFDSTSSTGYYLFHTGDNFSILDNRGDLVYYKPVSLMWDFALHANGRISYSNGFKFYLMDSLFSLTDSFTCKNVAETDPKDMQVLSNGHVLLMGLEIVEMDLGKYYKSGIYSDRKARVHTGTIEEQDAEGKVVFNWRARDHFRFMDVDTSLLKYDSIADWTHFSSLSEDVDGNILLSLRHFHEIIKINRNNGSVMWRFGGKHNQFKMVDCPYPFYEPRNVRRIANGNLTFLEGGKKVAGHGTRALEFKLDEKNKIATLVWSYVIDTGKITVGRGNVQRLDNGNTLVSYGMNSGSNVSFVVVDSSKRKLFEMDDARTFKAYCHSSLPWQVSQPLISCADSAGLTYLDAGAGYSNYQWSTGDSTRVIAITTPGDYTVCVPYGNGGFISSKKVTVTDISNLCKSNLFIKPEEK